MGGIYVSTSAFLGQVSHHIWILFHQRMGPICIWNGICPYLVLGLPACITVVLFAVCDHSPYNCCHILQPKCHLQNQIYLVNLKIFHLFFTEKYLLWGLLQTAISFLYLTNWHAMLWCMMISYQASGCDI